MTPHALYTQVTQRRRDTAGDLDAAAQAVADALAADPASLTRLWAELGPWWVRQAFHEIHQQETGEPGRPSSATSTPQPTPSVAASPVEAPDLSAPAPRAPATPKAVRPSWRAAVDPLDVSFPVADTGTSKPLGDFTRDDALAVARYYEARATQLQHVAGAWSALSMKLEPGQRLRDLDDVGDLAVLAGGRRSAKLGTLRR